jgi:hypothetical protein
LSYRTLIGDPLSGLNLGYKIHLIYNLLARPDDIAAKTLGETTEPIAFSWSVTGMQKFVVNNQPIDHLSIDSRYMDPTALAALEDQLYGTSSITPAIPFPNTLIT